MKTIRILITKSALFLCSLFLLACENSPMQNTPTNIEEKTYSQKELMDILIPELRSNGVLYKKTKAVLARVAKEGEKINTETSDGLETTNTAKAGDYIIKNQTGAGEMYIIGEEKFKDRYEFLEEADNKFSIYKAKGKVIALEMTTAYLMEMNFQEEFRFIAPWDEEMVVKKDDFLVCSLDYSEIYRIARKEFFETYQLD